MLVTRYAVKFRTTVFALIAVLAIAGPLTYMTLPREGTPDITIPYVFVTAAYEGVAPSEIENLITIPMENRLKNLGNVKEIRSTSAEGVSLSVIEFTPQQDIDLAVQLVKDKIDMAKPDMPEDLDEPTVQGLNFSTDIPVLQFAVTGDDDLERLKHVAEDLQDAIELLPGVLQTRLYGAREREIRVDVDFRRLSGYGLTMGDVLAGVRRENATVSAGNLDVAGNKLQVRVPGEFTSPDEMRELVLKVEEGRPIRLSDVATVTDSFKDLSSLSRLDGRPCLSIHVHKRSGENTVTLIDRVKALLAAQVLPPGIATQVLDDQSDYIHMILADLENNIATGFLMVVLILLLFMGVRNSVLVGVAIPFSFMIGFVVLSLMGLTLNMIVLFSLVLAVGMLVDNAIVIVENIYRHHAAGESRLDSALRGASEVAWPVATSTLTTLAAFFPMMYWPGIMGQFMGFLPKTVIIVLACSLFVALVINPAICSVLIGRRKVDTTAAGGGPWNAFVDRYERVVRGALDHRFLVVSIGFACLLLTVLLFGRLSKGVELFPEADPRRAQIFVRYPEGTDIATTDATMKRIESVVQRHGDVKQYLATVGSLGGGILGGSSGGHLGTVMVEFLPFGERKGSSLHSVDEMRDEIGQFPGAEVKVEKERHGPPTGSPVSIEVSGEDFDVLRELADRIMREIHGVPGLVDVQDDMEDAKPELQFVVDRERAAQFGLDTRTVGGYLRTAVTGESYSKFRAGEDEYDITVRLMESQRQSTDLLRDIYITNKDGVKVPLASLGAFEYRPGRGQILRKDQKRVITISGNNQERGVDRILKDVRERVEKLTMPKGYAVTYAGDNQEMQEAGAFLAKALVWALALIALILVMEFNSVLLPGIILFSVILSLAGVLWGLMIWGMRFGVIMTGIGVISLAGVVVNNGIVMIDCIKQRRAEGLSSREAVVAAVRLRLRPVLLTAITTATGLLPMVIGWGVDIHSFPPKVVRGGEMSQMWQPMAVAVVSGLVVATLLTLIQVPVMVSVADSLAARLKTWAGRYLSKD